MKNPLKFAILALLFSVTSVSLVSAEAIPEIKDNLTYGKKSPQVYVLQQELIKLGFMTGKATGAMYGTTMNAVRKFQAEMGISRTGVVGPETKATINTMLNQQNECLVVTVPQQGKVVSVPFSVSGFIKAGCSWAISGANAGTVQLVKQDGTALVLPAQVRTHMLAGVPRYPIFWSAQVVGSATTVSGPASLIFTDTAGMNTKSYPVLLQ